ncbi:unnamed protein product [Arabis nemorensis]|uniref:RRM domain-containing protein n=1 Tax=Arabis nemorensis TaxID=586526 RepID=A0A565B5Z6_9BRAS|nr:unnamed protein product [Arabis nemorensis]
MSQPNQNLDLKYTKIFVGGLAWKTTTDDLRSFFQQFGEVLDANVVFETYPTLRSKGFGFVTFRDAESADRALANPSPIIDGRRANINLAYLRAKNNNNNTNHDVNQVPPHQYPLAPQYPNPYFPPFYWNPNYGQVRYMPSVPYMAMTYPPLYVSTYGVQQNLQQRDTGRLPVRVSAPQSSSVRIHEVSENNKEVVVTADVKEIDTEPESDVDQEEEIMSGQDHNGLEQNVEDIDVDTLIGHNETVFEGTCQNERVFEAEDTPHANGFDLDRNCECASQMNGIDQEAQGEERMS